MFVVRHILPDRVETNVFFRFLYGIKLEGLTEVYRHLPEEDMIDLLSVSVPESKTVPNKYLFVCIYRTKTQEGLYVNEIYILSYDRDLLKAVQDKIGHTAKWLAGHELANVLIRLQTLYDDIQIADKKLIRQVRYFSREDILSPPIERSYREIVRQIEAQKRKEGKVKRVLAGARISEGDVIRMEQLIALGWTGVVWIMLDLNDLGFLLKRRSESMYPDRAEWKEIREAYSEGKLYLVGNSVFLITEDDNVDDYKLSLFSFLGYIPVEKVIDKQTVIASTLLTKRDMDYIHLIPPSVAGKYIPLTVERARVPEEPMIYGRNRHGSYVAFSYFDTSESENPHAIILAPPGSGKSVFMQNEVSMILGISIESLVKGTPSPPAERKYRIRYFDKGFSAELFFKLMKLRGYDVEMFASKPSEIRYNPCEVDSGEDYEFSAHMINAILEVLGLDPLQGDERIAYLKALKAVSEDDRRKHYLSQKVSLLRRKSENIYSSIKEAGFSDDDLIADVVRDPKFANLRHPVISDVHRFLVNSSEPVAKEAAKKISSVTEIPIFSFFTEINLKASRLFYLDMELLAESPYFVPLLLAILKKLFHADKFQKPEDEYAIYMFDEVHQLFRINAFYDALATQIKEARRFRIQMKYATQNPSDVPAKLIRNMKTKMFLAPQELTERESFLAELLGHLGLSEDQRNADPFYVFRKTPSYYASVWYARGAFSISLPIDQYKLKVFDSYRKMLETEDGIMVTKTTVPPQEVERLIREGRRVV